MSAPNPKPSKSRFRVVPPSKPTSASRSGAAATPSPQPPNPPNYTPPVQSFPFRAWAIAGVIVVALGAVSQIRVHPSVQAEAWLEPDQSKHRQVYLEIPGKITKVEVKPNQTVEVGQILAWVESEQLDEDISQWQLQLRRNQAELEAAGQSEATAQVRVQQAAILVETVQTQVNQLEAEIAQMEAGQPPAHIASYDRQIAELRQNAQSMNKTIQRYEKMAVEGVVSQEAVDEQRRRQNSLYAQIGEYETAKQMAIRQLRDELTAKREQLRRYQTEQQVASQERIAAQGVRQSQLPIQEQLLTELDKHQNQQQQSQVLRAPVAGKIVTPILHYLEGRTVQPGEPIMEIADTGQLVAVIEVHQEDRDLVREGAEVRFKPLEPGLESFTTEIKEILPVLERDEQLQKSTLQVTAVIDSSQTELQSGAKVYARIQSPEKISLLEQMRRELLKVFKVRKYT